MSRRLDIPLTGYNTADFVCTFLAEGIDPDTSESTPIDVSALTIVFTVDSENGGEEWVGTVGDGITLTGDDGEFTVWLPLATMQDMAPGLYNVGCTLSNGTVTTQLLHGTLTVIDGVVG